LEDEHILAAESVSQVLPELPGDEDGGAPLNAAIQSGDVPSLDKRRVLSGMRTL
jgi:hypothetical protein